MLADLVNIDPRECRASLQNSKTRTRDPQRWVHLTNVLHSERPLNQKVETLKKGGVTLEQWLSILRRAGNAAYSVSRCKTVTVCTPCRFCSAHKDPSFLRTYRDWPQELSRFCEVFIMPHKVDEANCEHIGHTELIRIHVLGIWNWDYKILVQSQSVSWKQELQLLVITVASKTLFAGCNGTGSWKPGESSFLNLMI